MEALTFAHSPSRPMLRLLAPLALLLAAPLATAQPASPAEVPDEARLQGYALGDDGATFVFDAASYDLTPERVVVTGAFRGWSTDMDDAAWSLATLGDGLWTLHVADPASAGLGPGVPFKFRIDAGRWLDPPASAPNAEGGKTIGLPPGNKEGVESELRQLVAEQEDPMLTGHFEDHVMMTADPTLGPRHVNIHFRNHNAL